jgi:beta-N-acetylhexosaminidase
VSETAVWARGVIAAGFSGRHFDSSLPWFGAYVLFARNVETIEQTRALSDALRARHDDGASPAVALDQEGGRVARLREGVEPMPSMMALGAVDDLELARRAGEQTAFDLRRAGCTVDFAPVLDLARQAGNTVIGTRSLGSDPESVAALGAAFCAGLQAGGIAPCPKHFPGHGSTAVDSHTALPVIESDAAELRARDLVPFGALARSVPAMMGAHVLAPAFDPDAPATRSARAISLLRRELGFEGAFVTDCLQMSALQSYGDVSDNAIAALKSGADLLIVSHDPALALEVAAAIEAAVDQGKLAAAGGGMRRLHRGRCFPTTSGSRTRNRTSRGHLDSRSGARRSDRRNGRFV